MTGLHNHANGQYGHQHSYHHFSSFPNVKSMPVLLAERGYRTASAGKYHVAPEEVYSTVTTTNVTFSPGSGQVVDVSGTVFRLAEAGAAHVDARHGLEPVRKQFDDIIATVLDRARRSTDPDRGGGDVVAVVEQLIAAMDPVVPLAGRGFDEAYRVDEGAAAPSVSPEATVPDEPSPQTPSPDATLPDATFPDTTTGTTC